MTDPELPPAADDPVGGWSVEDVERASEAIERLMDDTTPAAPPEPHPRQRRQRRERRERPPVERRPGPAGHALVVVVVALAASLLLNAPGLHKSAHGLADGWQRDVALAVTGPLETVSNALLLDRPRAAVKAMLGRSDDDTIDTEITLPPATPATSKPRTPARRAFTPDRPLRLWVAGDSLIVVPAESIVRAAGASPVIEPVGGIDGRIATGLERPDVFNWFRHIPERIGELRPGVVVLGFGGNDDHGYMTGLPEGVTVDGFDTPAWRREYARRAGGLMDAAARAGAYVVWLGLPITRDPEQTRRFDAINAVVAAQARKRPGTVSFVDTYTTFASDTGGFTEYLEDSAGRLTRVRGADGVHFERAGGEIIAREVLRRLNKVFDLTSWRAKKSEAAA